MKYLGEIPKTFPMIREEQQGDAPPPLLWASHSGSAGGESLHQTVDSFTGFSKTAKHYTLDSWEREELVLHRSYSPLPTPPKSLCVFLAFSWYSLWSWPALLPTALSTTVYLYRVLLQLITFNSCNTGLGLPSQGSVNQK